MKRLRSTMIEASAGSGKTWQLANRFLALLAMGVAPERMIALTFTRKAAGEFTERILQRLGEAAADEGKAKELAAELREVILGDSGSGVPALLVGGEDSLPSMDRAHFLRMLAGLVGAMDRLSLSTLDSFFTRMVRTLVLEMGMGGFDFLEEAELENQRMAVLAEIFSPEWTSEADREEFFQAFKLATFGSTETRLTKMLDEFVTKHHERYLRAPSLEAWGNEEYVWPQGCPWPAWKERQAIIDELREHFADLEWSHKSQPAKWEQILSILEEYPGGGQPLDEAAAKFFKDKIEPNFEQLQEGSATLKIQKDFEYVEPVAGLIVRLFGALMADWLRVDLGRSRGLGRILDFYERRYQRLVRLRGKLGFSDLTTLLAGHGGESPLAKEGMLQELAYRLDGFFDHWMLDEFQDTSRSQWKVIRTMVDEVVQDAEGGRSLFVVGDGKQSIYGWRGGDSRLFGELRDFYSGGIDLWPMDLSRRSVEDVLALVNRVCDLGKLDMAEPFPGEVVCRWNFREHASAVEGRGQAAVYELDSTSGGKDDEEADEAEGPKDAFMIGLLKRQCPLERGCSTAILVRSNAEGQRIAEVLRRNGIAVALESDVSAAGDGPAGAAVLDLLRWLRCPLDAFAWGHVSMTPLLAVLGGEGVKPGELWQTLHETIAADGMASFLEGVFQSLRKAGVLSSFSTGRLAWLAEEVAVYEARGGGSIDDWVRMFEKLKLRESGSPNEVQVMTTHKAKGLGFDFVIVTGLGKDRFASGRHFGVLESCKEPDQTLEHVLVNQRKAPVVHNKRLRPAYLRWEEDQCYEGCCNLYVALTRARSAVHVILDGRAKKWEPKLNTSDWIRQACEDGSEDTVEEGGVTARRLFHSGGEDWLPEIKEALPREEGKGIVLPPSGIKRRASRRASALSAAEVSGRGGWQDRSEAMAHGSEVHAHFEGIEWWPDDKVALPDTRSGKEVRAFLESREGGALFRKPDAEVVVWREVPIESVGTNEWLSGIIDRLVLYKGKSGGIERAEIIDFKTDRVADDGIEAAAAHHASQLDHYRRALAKALDIEAKSIAIQLAFTSACRVWRRE